MHPAATSTGGLVLSNTQNQKRSGSLFSGSAPAVQALKFQGPFAENSGL